MIYVVILNYNNERYTIECLNSLDLIKDFELKIIVVDNNSRNPDVIEKHVSSLENVTFIQTGENRGYAAGNNVGIKYAIDQGAEYICILNNDVIVNKDSFTDSIRILDSDEMVAFVGPSLLDYKSDVIQSQGDYISFCSLKTIKNMNRGKHYIAQNGVNNCHAIVGACILFKSFLIRKIGYIPEEYFLNFEETEWCYNAVRHGYKNYYSLSSYVNHKGSATIDCYSNLSFYYYNRNIIIFLLKIDPLKIKALLAIAILIFKSLVKILIGYKRKKTNKYILLCYVDGLLRTTRFKNFICGKGFGKII